MKKIEFLVQQFNLDSTIEKFLKQDALQQMRS